MATKTDVSPRFTPEAIHAIRRMVRRTKDIAFVYGSNSDEYAKAADSLLTALVSVLELGGEITSDGRIGLHGRSHMDYGVVAHYKFADGRRDPLIVEWMTHS